MCTSRTEFGYMKGHWFDYWRYKELQNITKIIKMCDNESGIFLKRSWFDFLNEKILISNFEVGVVS